MEVAGYSETLVAYNPQELNIDGFVTESGS
jgi:hypothetical protein